MVEHPSIRTSQRLCGLPAVSVTQTVHFTPASLKSPAVAELMPVQVAPRTCLIMWSLCKRMRAADLDHSGSKADPSDVCPPAPDPLCHHSPAPALAYFRIPQMAGAWGVVWLHRTTGSFGGFKAKPARRQARPSFCPSSFVLFCEATEWC